MESAREGEARIEVESDDMHSLLDRPDRPLCWRKVGEMTPPYMGQAKAGATFAAMHLKASITCMMCVQCHR
jgi:hypothetical protein